MPFPSLVDEVGHTLFLRVGRRGFDPRHLRRTKRAFFPPLAIWNEAWSLFFFLFTGSSWSFTICFQLPQPHSSVRLAILRVPYVPVLHAADPRGWFLAPVGQDTWLDVRYAAPISYPFPPKRVCTSPFPCCIFSSRGSIVLQIKITLCNCIPSNHEGADLQAILRSTPSITCGEVRIGSQQKPRCIIVTSTIISISEPTYSNFFSKLSK